MDKGTDEYRAYMRDLMAKLRKEHNEREKANQPFLEEEITVTLHLPMKRREYFALYQYYLSWQERYASFTDFIKDAIFQDAMRIRW